MKTAWLSTLLIALALTAMPLNAGQVMKMVWFPDGEITWRAVDFPSDLESAVDAAMDHLARNTPLDLVERPQAGELEIRWTTGLFDGWYGGMTKGYRNAGKKNKLIRISSELQSWGAVRQTVLHEMGHALGFTHEFQRPDRGANGVTICGNCKLDPFNFGIVGSKRATILTPYDFFSRFSTGYAGASPEHQAPANAWLSKHDVGAIYRVYGSAFGDVAASDAFGAAVTAGDYDGSGANDIAVASVEGSGPTQDVYLNFFKGVETDPSEAGTGTAYAPWFREKIASVPSDDPRVVLVSGQLKERDGADEVRVGHDGIDEIVMGLPGADEGDGEVRILVVNVQQDDGQSDSPLGLQGVHHETLLRQVKMGLSDGGRQEFGAALLLANLSNGETPDLVVGAPGTIVSDKSSVARGAGAVVYLPEARTGGAFLIENPSGAMPSRFGAALAAIPMFHEIDVNTVTGGIVDALVVGAPEEDTNRSVGADPIYFDAGAVYVYAPAANDAGVPIEPVQRDRIASYTDGQRFGTALAGFLTNETKNVWKPEFHLLAGGPDYAFKTFAGGKITLYGLDPMESAGTSFVSSATMPGDQAGAGFGTSLALFADSCRFGECRKGDVWVAVGAPAAELAGDAVGIVYRWDPWDYAGDPKTAGPMPLANGSPGSSYGSALAALNPLDPEGGFMVGGPGALVQFGLDQIGGGVVDLHFQQSHGDTWKGLNKRLGKTTTGDATPENR